MWNVQHGPSTDKGSELRIIADKHPLTAQIISQDRLRVPCTAGNAISYAQWRNGGRGNL